MEYAQVQKNIIMCDAGYGELNPKLAPVSVRRITVPQGPHRDQYVIDTYRYEDGTSFGVSLFDALLYEPRFIYLKGFNTLKAAEQFVVEHATPLRRRGRR